MLALIAAFEASKGRVIMRLRGLFYDSSPGEAWERG
jgi:hypothetical protein